MSPHRERATSERGNLKFISNLISNLKYAFSRTDKFSPRKSGKSRKARGRGAARLLPQGRARLARGVKIASVAAIFTFVPLAHSDCTALLVAQEVRKIKMYRPIKIDDYNTLSDVNCENSILKYEFTLIDDTDVRWSQMKRPDIKALYETHAGVVKRQYCAMPKMTAFHPFLRGVRFTYKTGMGKILYEIDVTNKDCGLEE